MILTKKKKSHCMHKARVMRLVCVCVCVCIHTIYKKILLFELNFYVIQKYP